MDGPIPGEIIRSCPRACGIPEPIRPPIHQSINRSNGRSNQYLVSYLARGVNISIKRLAHCLKREEQMRTDSKAQTDEQTNQTLGLHPDKAPPRSGGQGSLEPISGGFFPASLETVTRRPCAERTSFLDASFYCRLVGRIRTVIEFLIEFLISSLSQRISVRPIYRVHVVNWTDSKIPRHALVTAG